jgi:zinc transport system substrate-binding protein
MRRTWLAVSVALALASWSAPPAAAAPLRAWVSIPPQAYLAQRIGGRLVDVGILVPPGAEPHTFEPTPKQVASLAKARVFFAIGFPFEQRLLTKLKAANPDLLVVDTRRGVPLRAMSEAEEHDGREHHHEAGEPDVHVWLSPRLAKLISANICSGLQEVDPAHAADYERNLKALQADLDRLDARLAKALAPLKGKEFLVYHPAFGYFADAYGLKQVPVEMEGKEPSARQLAKLIDLAKRQGIKVVFVEPQFPRLSAERVAQAIGGVVVPLDPLAQDYIQNLEEIAARLQAALEAR